MKLASDDDIPEPDRVPGAPHPRHTPRVIGQDAAIADFLTSAASGRLHHGWLLTGPRGVGKATLAWAIARWLLADGAPDRLDVPADAPVVRRLAALSEPGLMLIR
ncbi:MAG: DNA polymerase III subunit delta', partial [Paracoccus sp. (in: a-proteobacteria)]|nr:DNA polymerase III subunit delta' [Paracoccus sp. (in: a-proteobacteria)]